MNTVFSWVYFVILYVCVQGIKGNVFTTEEETKMKSYINTMISCRNVTGLSLAATKNGDVFTDGFGVANVEKSESVTSNTKMNIGSITKSLTSIVLAAVISEEKKKEDPRLDWETKVQKILGSSFELNSDCLTNLVTLEDFLSHRTGLYSADITLMAGIPKQVTRADLMRNIKYLESSSQFRDIWNYCNACYGMVGYILEKVTKKSWEQAMTEMLFVPLNMTSTEYISEKVFNSLATPYINVKGHGLQKSDPRIYTLDQFGPAGSVCSTADDMSKIMKWMTTNEYSKLGISKDVFDSLFEQKSIVPLKTRERYSVSSSFPVRIDTYGYGKAWMLSKFRGFDMYFHTGGFHGFSAFLGFIPSQNISVFLNSNGIGESGFTNTMLPTAFYLFDILLDFQPWLNESNVCTYPSPWKEGKQESTNTTDTDHINVDNASRFYGNYSSPFYGDFRVYELNNTINVEYGVLFQGILSYHSGSIFNMTVVGALADELPAKTRVEFENFDKNVFMRVRVDNHTIFDRITSDVNMSTKLSHWFSLYFVVILLVITYHVH